MINIPSSRRYVHHNSFALKSINIVFPCTLAHWHMYHVLCFLVCYCTCTCTFIYWTIPCLSVTLSHFSLSQLTERAATLSTMDMKKLEVNVIEANNVLQKFCQGMSFLLARTRNIWRIKDT